MKLTLDKVHFDYPTVLDITRLQKIIDENDLTPVDIKYRFSKLYDWKIKIVNGKLVLGYTVRCKRPSLASAFTCNHMIVFESMDRFILQDKNGVMHGCGKTDKEPYDVSDIDYRKWVSAKKIADFMGLSYLGNGVFEKVAEKSEQSIS